MGPSSPTTDMTRPHRSVRQDSKKMAEWSSCPIFAATQWATKNGLQAEIWHPHRRANSDDSPGHLDDVAKTMKIAPNLSLVAPVVSDALQLRLRIERAHTHKHANDANWNACDVNRQKQIWPTKKGFQWMTSKKSVLFFVFCFKKYEFWNRFFHPRVHEIYLKVALQLFLRWDV